MNCLLCGAKLAIFRKSSIGDFCTLEHRALYLAEHGAVGQERRAVAHAAGAAGSSTWPGNSEFSESVATAVSERPESETLPAASTFMSDTPAPISGVVSSVECIAFRTWSSTPILPTPPLRSVAAIGTAGLVLPWSGAAHLGFSLSSLVAAAWARDGSPVPAAAETPRFSSTLNYPLLGQLDLPEPIRQQVAAAAKANGRHAQSNPVTHGATAFDIPASRTDFLGHRQATDPLMIRRTWTRPDAPAETNSGLRPVVAPQLILPQPDLPKIDIKESIQAIRQAAAARAAEAMSRYDVEEYKVPRIPPRPSADDWQHNLSKVLPPAPTLLAMAACALFTFAAISFLALPKPVFSAGEGQGFTGNLANFRSLVRNRSAIRIQDDFRSGLSGWDGIEGWAKDWAYDQAGSLRPGKLGLWRKSMKLVDYKMEFLGQIEKKGLSWVFRASDTNNYHAAKIMITKPGPLPLADLVRYTVVDGVPGPRTAVTLPFAIRNDTLYQVQMDVNGNRFSTKVNGRIVDSWVDNHHASGGVGFFSETGEQSRVRWLRVSHRDDFIGRVCSYLTAQNLLPQEQDEILASATILIDGDTILIVR